MAGRGAVRRPERPGWGEEVERLAGVVAALPPARVLDVACGTGFLTRWLQGSVVAIDQSPAMVAIARERVPGARIAVGDAVPLPFADDAFDRVLTSHFYGHLLPGERDAFLAEARRVAAGLVVVDSALRADGEEEEAWQERVLGDGSRHRVYKRWFTPRGLAAELGKRAHVLHAGAWFVVVASGDP